MALSGLASVFSGPGQTGTSALYGVGTSQRYHQITSNELLSRNLHRKISSSTVFASASADPALVLFGSPVTIPDWLSSWISIDTPDYTGRFVQIANLGTAARNVNLSSFSFDNAAQSGLLVATSRRRELRLSFRDLFLRKWNETLDSVLSGGARRKGSPTLTWEMFPRGVSYLDSGRTYLKVRQNLHIEIDWWPDYEAWIQYHIFLFVNSAGNPRGAVHRWEYWIEGGAKSDDIEDRLRPAVENGVSSLNSELTGTLSGFDGFGLSDLYYLPGRQLSPTASASGLTTDDVTIVVEL